MKRLHIIWFTFCLCFSKVSISQKGNYFIHNYLPSQYLASDQNRSIVQDKYGRIIVANNDGLLINSGTEWLTIRLGFLCLSLAKNDQEEMFVGGDGGFGRLEQTDNGEFKVVTLMHLLPKNEEVNKIWSIITIKDHVYFCSNQKIYDYHKGKIHIVLPGAEGFHTFFKVGDHLVIKERGKGLEFLSYNDQLVLFRGGELFADNSTPVRGIITKKSKQYIISPKGVFEFAYNNSLPEVSEIKKINTPLDKWLSEKTVYCAANIGKDNFAFGSVVGGLVITDLDLNPQKYINSSNELQDDGVNFIYNDYQGHIWLALAKGLSLIEFNSPVTRFTKTDGIVGTIEGCISFNNTLFVATDKGVLCYDHTLARFVPTNITEMSWCLQVVNGQLVAGTKFGLYRWEKNEFKMAFESQSDAHCILRFPTTDSGDIIYVGTETGYLKLSTSGNSFSIIEEKSDLNTLIRSVVKDKEGNVYMGTLSKGVFVDDGKKLNTLDDKMIDVESESLVLSYGDDVFVFNNGNVLLIKKKNGEFVLQKSEAFEPITKRYVFLMTQMVVGNSIWGNYKLRNDLTSPEGLVRITPINNVFEVAPSQLSRIKESDTKSMCVNDSLVYFGTNNGLYCYDTKLTITTQVLNTFVNKVRFGRDSVRYYYNLNPNTKPASLELDYRNNSIEVYPGASDFIDRNALLFACYLEGLEDSYKEFSNKKVITYEYLHEGNYVLHIKSKNILGKEGQEILIPFTVLPPWYRTVWAYIGYVIIFLLAVAVIIKVYAKRLIEQNIRLERIIADRTKEIQKQKGEIEHKNQEITDSINYAKGIQDSILPEINEIKKSWKDIFIFFQPKDIVSGDFYWFKSINDNEFLIACCDCTGHGVPGGFMSMICSGRLHDAALISTEPDQLLFHANNSIKMNLRQQGESKNKDGMEICLMRVNTKTREVKYAGANRALWIYDANEKQIKEIKPTKSSIASSTEFDSKYEMHTFNLKEGDIIYASSDGYADQFGGKQGKKYMSKNFRSFLLEKVDLPMSVQCEALKANINSWMGDHEQVDDLLVIGVKL